MNAADVLKLVFTGLPVLETAAAFGVGGLFAGQALFRWMIRLTDWREPSDTAGDAAPSPLCLIPIVGALLSPKSRYRGVRILGWGTLVELVSAGLFAAFVFVRLEYDCQSIPEVQPDEFWRFARILYHLVLIAFLIAATGTDFREYVIPDRITAPGTIFAVLLAAVSGDLQMLHVWVDWYHEVPGVRGPYIPEWVGLHPHWHGLAWSLAGAATGAGATWLVRFTASLILGEEAMGFGDVTLMAMIGGFVGWQATLVVLALSPFCGVALALAVRLFSGKVFVPFGPFLALGALCVLFGWRWIWLFELPLGVGETFSVRKLFGDWPSLLIVKGLAFGALVVLLGLLRFYRGGPAPRDAG